MPSTFVGGVGGQPNTTYYDTLTIDLGQGISFTTRAGFTAGMETSGIGLLGQQGFFEAYRVEFHHTRKLFLVESL
jgi:hypothetical protein